MQQGHRLCTVTTRHTTSNKKLRSGLTRSKGRYVRGDCPQTLTLIRLETSIGVQAGAPLEMVDQVRRWIRCCFVKDLPGESSSRHPDLGVHSLLKPNVCASGSPCCKRNGVPAALV